MGVGAAIGLAAIQQGMGMGTAAFNNWLAQQREREARWENFKYNEASADMADKRTRALYNDLQSPRALLEQYKEAGLSPSLMFSGGGAGGGVTQGAQGNGTNGIMPHTYGMNPVDMAQIQLMTAQANKANEEANTVKELRGATLEKLIAETNNINLKNAGQRFTNRMLEIQKQIDEATKDNKIEISTYELLKADRQFLILKEELEQEIVATKISKETADTIINEEKQRLINLRVQAALMNSQKQLADENIQLTKAQIESIASEISKNINMVQIGWEHLYLEGKQLDETIRIWEESNDIKHKGVIASIINSAMSAGAKMIGH